MAHQQPPTRKSGQNANKNSIQQPKPVKLKLPVNGEHFELPQKNKTPSKLATNSSQIHHQQQQQHQHQQQQQQRQQQQQQRQTKSTKSLHDAKRAENPRPNGTKGNVHSYHNYHQQADSHRQHPLDHAQTSRCMQRCSGATSVTTANLKSHSKLLANTTTTSKIEKHQSDLLVTMKEAKAKVKPKANAPTDVAEKLIQEQRQPRNKNSNTNAKHFFDKYLKFAYDLTTPEGVRQLEAHFFPTTQPQNEQQQQQDNPQPPGKDKSLQLDTRLAKGASTTENALNQSKYF